MFFLLPATNAQSTGNLMQVLESSRNMCSALAHCLTVFTQQEEVSPAFTITVTEAPSIKAQSMQGLTLKVLITAKVTSI